MDDVFVLRELDQLKAMSDPLRLSVLGQTVRGPVTIAQVAERLEENPRKLYYHFTELERLGLIQIVETRQKGNLIEKWYQAVAKFFSVDWTLFNRSAEGQQYLAQNVTALLHNSATDLQRHFQENHLSPEQLDQIWPLHSVMQLKAGEFQEFRQRLLALLDEFRGRKGEEREETASLTLLLYPFTASKEEPE
jgi:DNA-binding transcriptional ArsR family regulator